MDTYPVIAVAGLPGAALPPVASYLHRKGWLLTWPGQRLTKDADLLLRTHSENPECWRLHSNLFLLHDITPLSRVFPQFYKDCLHPDDYRCQFRRPFVVSDYRMAPVLDWWFGVVDIVVDVQVDALVSLSAVKHAAGSTIVPSAVAEEVLSAWKNRYESNLRQFGHVVPLRQEDVLAGKFAALDLLLEEVVNEQSR